MAWERMIAGEKSEPRLGSYLAFYRVTTATR
jgi:hypothetical protein